jgi:hypothetical protein
MYHHIKLTEEQARSIYGQELSAGWTFCLTKDINEDYFLDPYQIYQAEDGLNPEFKWLREIPLCHYVPYSGEAQLQGSGSVNF